MKKLFLSILLVLCSGYLFSQNTRQGNDTIDFRDHSAYNPISLTETGYGTEKNSLKWSVTGLNRDKLQKIPAGDVLSRLQGLVPGLTVIGSGQPGEMPLSFIRGMGRLMGSTPLFIVDGVPFVDISLLNPEDIESVAVLKDASAGIYGVRSGNGVIIISTRKAEKGFHVQYNTFMGLQMPGKGTASQVLNTKEHADLQWLVYKNDNTTETHPNYGPSTNSSPTLPSWAANTDWYDALTDRALIQDHDLSVSAGSDNAKALLGVTYYDQDGIILNTDTKRYSVRLNSEISFFKKRIKIGENVAMARRSGRYVPNLTDDSPITMGPYRTGSIIPVYITQPLDVFNHSFQPGEFGGTNMAPRLGNSTNVVADRIRNADDIRDDVNYGGNIYSDISLFKGLNWITSYARTWTGTEAIDYEYPTYENAENNTRSYLSALEIKQNSWVITSALSFNRTFGKNYIQVAGGFEEFRDSYRSYMETSYDIETWTGLKFPEYNVPLPPGLRSEFLKAEYSFNNKYLISYNLRIEKGVKVKTPANVYLLKKRLVYPAISLGWRMSEEKFMNNIGWLDDLKLRASYGKTGSSQPGNYWYEEEYAYSTDLGFDTWLFNNHMGIIFDWFYRQSWNVYAYDEFLQNYRKDNSLWNSGIEGSIDYNYSKGNFRLNAVCNIASYRNLLNNNTGYFYGTGMTRIGPAIRNQSDYPVSSFFGYEVTGLFRDNNEISGAPSQTGAQPGFFRYANQNSDNIINSDDRVVLGSPNPDFTTTFDLELAYKRFDLSGLFYWSQGNEIFNFTKWWTDFWPSFSGQKSKRLLYDSWTEQNKNTSVPKASNTSNFSTNTVINSFYIEDGSYLRLKTIRLGYSFNEASLRKARISSLYLYLQAVNLFTLTKYSGLDPEIGGDATAFGIDKGNYPNTTQFMIGLRLGI